MWSSDILFEIYVGVVALVGTAIGLWVAMKFGNSKTNSQKENVAPVSLTDRQHEVLQLISQGLSNAEIADKLFLSLSSVKREVSGLFLKMDVKNRAEAQRKSSHFSPKS